MGKIEGKTVIVTGASRGIGAAISRLMASEGGRVICAARTATEGMHPLGGSLQTTVEEIQRAGFEAHAVAVDISIPEECDRLFTIAHQICGPIDILVNNAALTYFLPVEEYPINRWMRSWAVNVHAPFILSQLALKDMLPRNTGRIINISSVAAIGPGQGPYETDPGTEEFRLTNGTCYGSEKAALERFSQGLASEVYSRGVGVAAVAPSLIVPTPGTVFHGLVDSYSDPRAEDPDVLALAVLLLATEDLDQTAGRVCYSQHILREFGWIENAEGPGIDPNWPVSGFTLR